MTISAQILASGEGWSVRDVVCRHGPRDRAFVEEHTDITIAAVTEGSFQYRTTAGAAVLVPGSLLLGDPGSCFECGHEHAQGDRCLSFQFAPAYFERLAAGVSGCRKTEFDREAFAPAPELIGLLAGAEVSRKEQDAQAFEELAVRLAGAVLKMTVGRKEADRQPNARDERRVTRVVRRIEMHADQKIGLDRLASEAAMSPYHFLRTFRQVTGVTPHQYVLYVRLSRAVQRLRRTTDAISTIALEAGFNDLATFNRRFRRLIGMTPSAFRTARQSAPQARSIRPG